MTNLFKDAKLGDKFQRFMPSDKYFVFVKIYTNQSKKMAKLMDENRILSVNLDGTHPIDCNLNVVGKWKEPIDLTLIENGQLIRECIKRHIYIEPKKMKI